MTDTTPESENRTPDPQPAGPIETFRLGVSVWLSEVKWLGTSLVRRFEISRLAKRLEEEYTRLGRVAESPRGRKPEKDLCLKQIAFLKDELTALERELEDRSTARVNRLRDRAAADPVEPKAPTDEDHNA